MRRPLAVLALAALVACGSTEPADEFNGAYNLTTVNGQPLPFVTTFSNVTARLTAGFLVVSPKGEWSLVKSGTTQVGTQAPTTSQEFVTGTWYADGAAYKLLSYDPPTVITATHSGGAVTYTDGGRTYVYRR